MSALHKGRRVDRGLRVVRMAAQERKFSERPQAALNRYRSREVESTQVFEELIALAKDFRLAAQQANNWT